MTLPIEPATMAPAPGTMDWLGAAGADADADADADSDGAAVGA